MPEAKKTKDEQIVDIDTSGPDATKISIEEVKEEAVVEQPEETFEQKHLKRRTSKQESKKSR